ncbi:MAG: DUF4352 domain-containing protein [Candidatus Geothermincolales bacterium]
MDGSNRGVVPPRGGGGGVEPRLGQANQPCVQPPVPPAGIPPAGSGKRKWPYLLVGVAVGIILVIVLLAVVMSVGVRKAVETAEEVGLINTETRRGRLGESIPCGKNLLLTVHSAYRAQESQYFRPDPGNYHLVLDVEFVNVGKEEEPISSLLEMSIRDSSGREYDIALAPETMTLPEGDITPGEKARGLITFELPETETSGLLFEFTPVLGDKALVELPPIR